MEEMNGADQENCRTSVTVFDALKSHGILPGNVVLSKAGHDIHRIYLVLSVEEKMALLADGTSKGINHPKKKRVTHLKPIGILDDREQKISRLHSLHNEPDQNRLIREWLMEAMNEFGTNKKREEP